MRLVRVFAKMAIWLWAVYAVIGWGIALFGSSDDGLHGIHAILSLIGVVAVVLPALGVLAFTAPDRHAN